jgi:hypothetical protein
MTDAPGEVQYLSWRENADAPWQHRIVQADPWIRIATDLLKAVTQPERLHNSVHPPDYYLDPTWHGNMSDLRTVTFRDDCGQQFIYRAVKYDPQSDGWLMEWPD